MEEVAKPTRGEYVNYKESGIGMAGVDSVVAYEGVNVYADPATKKTVIARHLSLTFVGRPQRSIDPKEGVCWTSSSVTWKVVDVRSLSNEIPAEIGVGEYTNMIDIGDSRMTCCESSGHGVGGGATIPSATVVIKSRNATTVEGEIKTPDDEQGQLRTIMTFRAPFEW
jgi:hypothetical protein